MIVKTQNSTYEIDTEKKQIRRLFGVRERTARQAEGWQEYLNITTPRVGESMVIIWASEGKANGEVLLRTTQTSTIKEIGELSMSWEVN